MKKTILLCSIVISAMMFYSCGPTISGKDEASFKASRAKVEAKLNEKEKIDLEKALRVMVLKAMSDKFNQAEKYKGKSFDEISLSFIDGKTFSGIVDAAEDFLKKDNEDKKKRTKKELDSLSKEQGVLQQTTKALDQFKLTNAEITQDEFFDEMVPYLDLTFVNHTKDEVVGEFMIQIDVFAKSTGKLLGSVGTGGTFSNPVYPDEIYKLNEVLPPKGREHAEKVWKTLKYPLKDFAPVDLVIKAYATTLTTKKGGKSERPKALEDVSKKIMELEVYLKELEKMKGSLNELELSR